MFIEDPFHFRVSGKTSLLGSLDALLDACLLPGMEFQELADRLIDQVIARPVLLLCQLVQFLDLFAVGPDTESLCTHLFLAYSVHCGS